MRAVKRRDTIPELRLRRALWAAGLRGWRCDRRTLPGRPDIAFGRAKVAVFVDGGFWHGHPKKWWPGRSGPYWDQKIQRNIERDRKANAELEALGWAVLRFWDFDVTKNPEATAEVIAEAVGRSLRTR